MRKNKGAALPGAVALCSIMLILSVTVAGTVVSVITTNKARRLNTENELDFLISHEQFIANGAATNETEYITSSKYDYMVYANIIEDHNVKALVAFIKNTETPKYYSVYDFTSSKVLAYQTSNLYIYEDEDYIYYGGIVQVGRE